MKGGGRIRPGDIIMLAVLLAAALALTALARPGAAGKTAVVTVGGDPVAKVRLDLPGRLEVEGPLGVTVVETDGSGVRIVSSPCPHHYCVRQGRITMRGQAIICVPNRVAVRIIGDGKSGVDGVTG